MRNLYWSSQGSLRSLSERPFASEQELERYIDRNQELLGGDIYIFRRQIRTGSHEGIPDMIGVDQDGRVCIIEIKNSETDESVLPQALGYAIWAETNPDSIKAIWLETPDRPEDMSIGWDSMDIRVILVAPAFRETVRRMASRIGFDVDLFEVQRYCLDDQELVLVELVEKPSQPLPRTTTGRQEWDWDYYRQEHGDEATAQMQRAVQALDEFFRQQGWDLPYNVNKGYVGFKYNNLLVAQVCWGGTYAWNIELKLPEGAANDLAGEHWEFQRYRREFKTTILRPLQPEAVRIEEIVPLLTQAYRHVTGAD